VQLELDAINRIVTVKISDLALGAPGAPGALGGYRGGAAAGALGGYRGGVPGTPGYQGGTPGYGGSTPGYVGATPMRVDPTATPRYATQVRGGGGGGMEGLESVLCSGLC
jgi:hypothetical protein